MGCIGLSTKPTQPEKNSLNALDGKTWTRYSISIWDVSKTPSETRLKHPALFPQELVQRLLEIYTNPGDTILDPFMGAGSTLVVAQALGRKGVGFEISQSYIKLAKKRLANRPTSQSYPNTQKIYFEDARHLADRIPQESIDLVITSPPYWDIHQQRRTADKKPPRPYTSSLQDIGNIASYEEFLKALSVVADQLFAVIKPGRWCIIIVMDIRKKAKFYPFHIDCIHTWTRGGFQLEDIIIWDRRADYHNLRPLGYPTTFRVNKVHEYILIFRKPG